MITPRFIEARKEITHEGLKRGIITQGHCDAIIADLDKLLNLYNTTQEETDRIYGEIVKQQATINLKDYES